MWNFSFARCVSGLALLVIICHSAGYGKEEEKPPEASRNKNKEVLKEEVSESHHTALINGVKVPYKAVAGTMLLKDEEGEDKASIFYIAYTKEGEKDLSKRPITFCFNGGPGSASIWLHMGTFGPKRVVLTEEGCALSPYCFANNDHSLLDVTDLVFIDPVSTGYSRVAPGEDPKNFHGVEEDIQSVAEFIRLYVTRNMRWVSPKFLAGESYGTTRAAGLAGHLHDEHKMYLNGVILVSSVLNFQAYNFDEGNDLPYILYLPSYTATAWYHQKLAPELQADLYRTLKEVENFALNEYALALLKEGHTTQAERQETINKLARYTGLSPEYLDKANMRVKGSRFFKELLRSEKQTVGRFDSRFKGVDADATGDHFEHDPSADVIFGGFTAAFNQYVREELRWEKDQEYKVLANVWPWNFGKANNQYLNVAGTLREVMLRNPSLQVFVANGYYDLATPYFASEYTIRHLGLDPTFQSHLVMKGYEAGHMMYIHGPSHVKLKEDLAQFIQRMQSKA